MVAKFPAVLFKLVHQLQLHLVLLNLSLLQFLQHLLLFLHLFSNHLNILLSILVVLLLNLMCIQISLFLTLDILQLSIIYIIQHSFQLLNHLILLLHHLHLFLLLIHHHDIIFLNNHIITYFFHLPFFSQTVDDLFVLLPLQFAQYLSTIRTLQRTNRTTSTKPLFMLILCALEVPSQYTVFMINLLLQPLNTFLYIFFSLEYLLNQLVLLLYLGPQLLIEMAINLI